MGPAETVRNEALAIQDTAGVPQGEPDGGAFPDPGLDDVGGLDVLLAGAAQTIDPRGAAQTQPQQDLPPAEQKVEEAKQQLASAEARLASVTDGGFQSIRAVEHAVDAVTEARVDLQHAELELAVERAQNRLDDLKGGASVRALENAVDTLHSAEVNLADFRAEHGIETNPLAGQTVFPVGGGQYNVGYDANWNNFGDGALHNSDFSFNATDVNHQNGHLGIDIFAPRGAPILATVDGTVVGFSPADGAAGGNRVWIEQEQPDGSSRYFYYAHLESLTDGIQVGDEISAGDQIGTMGNSGSAQGTEPHLHFSILEGGGRTYSAEFAVDPFDHLQVSVDEAGQPALQ